MKFDMHCHTKEGSIDAKVDIETYIKTLISKGFDGMLVTDHNSYKGYEHFKNIADNLHLNRAFTVLKGIEYDTKDGGHIIAILPENVHCALLEIRGMTTAQIEKLVHGLGGILGPAHPFDTGYYAFMNTKAGKLHQQLLNKFDFIETINSCAKPGANQKALHLAKKYKKPNFAGSDAHHQHVVGTSFTEFRENIFNNDDLIQAVKNQIETRVHGNLFESMHKNVNIIIEKLGIAGYWVYNQLGTLFYAHKRRLALKPFRHLL